MNDFDLPWDNPDLAFQVGDRIYLTVEQLLKVKGYTDKLKAVAKAVKDFSETQLAKDFPLNYSEKFSFVLDALKELEK